MRNLTPSTPSKYPHRKKLYSPSTKVSDMDPWRERYSLKQICAFVTLSTGFQAPDEGTEKYRAEGTVLCVRGFVFLGVCCLFEIGAGLSRVSMPPLMIACSSIRYAPTVFKMRVHSNICDSFDLTKSWITTVRYSNQTEQSFDLTKMLKWVWGLTKRQGF